MNWNDVISYANNGNLKPDRRVEKTEAEWKKQLTEEEVAKVVDSVIAKTGAASMKDMGKVMGMVNSQLAGKADGKTISTVVKARLS